MSQLFLRLSAVPSLLVVLLACIGLGGCAADVPSQDEVKSTEAPIIGGLDVPADYDSAVGRFITTNGSWCTATLVSPKVILTAAHCVSYGHGPGNWGTFITYSWGQPFSYTVISATSFGTTYGLSHPGNADVALLKLGETVASLVAEPKRITNNTYAGASMTLMGFGCNVNGGGSGAGQKRLAWGTMSPFGPLFPSAEACPGDSGGPLTYNGTGEIFGVTSSGWSSNNQWDPTLFAFPRDVWPAFTVILGALSL